MPFRTDLDFEQQNQSIREHRDRVRHRVAMADWMETRASRENHRIMLHMLVHEAERANTGTTIASENPINQLALNPNSSQYIDLHLHIDALMSQQDNYGAALQEIGRLGLFNNKTPSNSPNSSTSSCNESPAKGGLL